MKLIALCGAAGAGKDTVADMLPLKKLAFADKLYEEVAEEFNVTVPWLRDRDIKDNPQPSLFGMTGREALCMVADRNREDDPDCYVTALIKRIDGPCVITDVRFHQEAEVLRELGAEIWQVVRPGVIAGSSGHASDVDGSQFEPDRIIVNDGSIQDLQKKVWFEILSNNAYHLCRAIQIL